MAQIRPFTGIHYAKQPDLDLSKLIAPPYDVLNERGKAVEAMLHDEVPLQRFGTPEEIASLAAYLCSPLAAFATGACFVVDGGQTRSL